MYCPKCSQQQPSDDLRFCSRCGFSLSGVNKLVAAGGSLEVLGEEAGRMVRSPRRRGVEQGVILLFASVLLLPLVNVIASPYHEILIFTVLFGGILRILYALAFQEGELFKLRQRKEPVAPSQVGVGASPYALPDSQATIPDFDKPRAETAEIIKTPGSVTENTTRLLDKQIDPENR